MTPDDRTFVVAAFHQSLNTLCETFNVPTPRLDDDFVDDVLFSYDHTEGM